MAKKTKTVDLSGLSVDELNKLYKQYKKRDEKLKGYERKKKLLQSKIDRLNVKIAKVSGK